MRQSVSDTTMKMGQLTDELTIPTGLAHFPNPIKQFFHPIL